jgi:FkbM family methyltransferase
MDFIEIGTSDFDTMIEKVTNENGISIDPIKYYLDRLPEKPNVKKMNVAVSNKNGTCNVYYISPDDIIKYNLPDWIRGCNSINTYHKTVVTECTHRSILPENIIKCDKIDTKTLFTIINENNINGIYSLKIDTEGHDCIILKQFYNDIINNEQLPHEIIFESNVLSDINDVNQIKNLFLGKGYDLIYSNHDTKMKLNITQIKNKTKFTGELHKYYIQDYPQGYDNHNPPHENTLESAQKYCTENNFSGVTFQYGRYEVRSGKYILYHDDDSLISWIYL